MTIISFYIKKKFKNLCIALIFFWPNRKFDVHKILHEYEMEFVKNEINLHIYEFYVYIDYGFRTNEYLQIEQILGNGYFSSSIFF